MKIGIIGDIHLRERPPACRKDDYLTNALIKLEHVLKENDKVICLGDVFNAYNNSDYLFYKVYELLSRHPKKFITILGNHDIMGRNHNDLCKTTIGSLEATSIIEIKKEAFTIDGTTLAVSLVDKSNFNEIPIDTENENILLGHNYLEMDLCPEESLNRAEIKNLNYSKVFLGHEHSPCEEVFMENSHIIRMGSFTRCDSQTYNEDREIVYYQYDTKTRDIERKVVPSLSKEEVFVENAFEKRTVKSTVNFLKIAEVLQKFKRQSEGNISLLKTLERIKCPQKYVTMLKHFHEVNGLGFN